MNPDFLQYVQSKYEGTLKSTTPDGYFLDSLAAAYAEVGKFDDAITTQEKAIDLLKREGMPKNMIYQGIKQLKSFKAHKPWRERRFGKLRCKK